MNERGALALLGLDEAVDLDAVKAAWRVAAATHHPDRGGDPAQFDLARQAYEFLCDTVAGRDAADIEPAGFERGPRGDTISRELRLSFSEAVHGGARTIHQSRKVRCGRCRGWGKVDVSTARPSGATCHRCAGQGRTQAMTTVSFDIPTAANTGDVIVVDGAGDAGPLRGPTGALHLEVVREPHRFLRTNGHDLLRSVRVPMVEAALGAQRRFEGLEEMVSVTVPAGTQHGDKITVEGHGVPRPGGGRGALVLTVEVEVPDALDDPQRRLLRDLAVVRGEHTHLLT